MSSTSDLDVAKGAPELTVDDLVGLATANLEGGAFDLITSGAIDPKLTYKARLSWSDLLRGNVQWVIEVSGDTGWLFNFKSGHRDHSPSRLRQRLWVTYNLAKHAGNKAEAKRLSNYLVSLLDHYTYTQGGFLIGTRVEVTSHALADVLGVTEGVVTNVGSYKPEKFNSIWPITVNTITDEGLKHFAFDVNELAVVNHPRPVGWLSVIAHNMKSNQVVRN